MTERQEALRGGTDPGSEVRDRRRPIARIFRRFRLPFGLGEIRVGRAPFLLFLGAVIGASTGLVVVGYRMAVDLCHELIQVNPDHQIAQGFVPGWLLRMLMPALGGLVVGWLLYRVMKSSGVHGVPGVIRAVRVNRVRFPVSMIVPSISSVAVIATGGSAGPEGPVAEIGSVLGAKVGRLARVHRHTYRTLVAAGVAAAIAAVFNSPIGGVFFALEVILLEFEIATFAPVLLASVCGSLVGYAFFPDNPALSVPESMSFAMKEIPLFALLGVVMGLVSIALIRSVSWSGSRFQQLQLPRWVKPAIGGLGVGLIGFALPQVMGEGYSVLAQQFRGEFALGFLVLLIAGKWIATCLTIGSGAPGGIFAPAMVIGGCAGAILGASIHAAFPGFVADPGAYAVMGVAGAIAGVLSAPMTAILIMLRQLEGNYLALLPLMTTIAMTHVVMARWKNVSYYTYQLQRAGEWMDRKDLVDPLAGLHVGDVLQSSYTRLPENLTVRDALNEIQYSRDTVFVIVDREDRYLGIVTLSDLRLALPDPAMAHLVTLGDLADRHVVTLTPRTRLRDAVELITQTEHDGLPVFDETNPERVVGIVTRANVLDTYRRHPR